MHAASHKRMLLDILRERGEEEGAVCHIFFILPECMGNFVLDLDVNSMLRVHSGCKRVSTQIDLDFLARMPAYFRFPFL